MDSVRLLCGRLQFNSQRCLYMYIKKRAVQREQDVHPDPVLPSMYCHSCIIITLFLLIGLFLVTFKVKVPSFVIVMSFCQNDNPLQNNTPVECHSYVVFITSKNVCSNQMILMGGLKSSKTLRCMSCYVVSWLGWPCPYYIYTD